MIGYTEAGLTPTEMAVLVKVAKGLEYKQIGNERTVRNHMQVVKQKLGVRNRVGVVVWAWTHGLIE